MNKQDSQPIAMDPAAGKKLTPRPEGAVSRGLLRALLLIAAPGGCDPVKSYDRAREEVKDRVDTLVENTGPAGWRPAADLIPVASVQASPIPPACLSTKIPLDPRNPFALPYVNDHRMLTVSVKDSKAKTMELCLVADNDVCPAPAAVSLTYSFGCCTTHFLKSPIEGPTMKQVVGPPDCAGLTVCCYRGKQDFHGGPGRPLTVDGYPLSAALRPGSPAWS